MPILTLPAPLIGATTTPVVPTPAGTYTALIGGAYVRVIAGTLSVQNAIGQRSQGSLSVYTPLGQFWQYGTQVLVYDASGALVYAGYTTKDKAYRDPGARQGDTGYLLHDLTLMDNSYRADKRRAFKNYTLTTAGAIVRDLLGSYLAAEGVTATATSIATGPGIQEVVWNGTKSVSDALTWLAQLAGYWWQIDLNGVLWFQPYGGVPAPFAIDGTNVDSMQDVNVEYGNDMFVNRQYVKGSFAEIGPLTQTFHGDGLTRSFTLAYPISTLSSLVLDGVDVTSVSLRKGDTGGMFYYAPSDAVIAQDAAQPILTSGDTLVVTYKGRYPVLASAQNNTLIAAQQARERIGSGIVEAVYTDTKVRTFPAAAQIASGQLSHYGSDAATLTFSTQSAGLMPGQMLNVNLPDYALTTTQMLINSVTISDQNDGINIWFTVVATGSGVNTSTGADAAAPLEAAQWQTYWQNLMSQSSDPSDYTDAQDTSLALLSSSQFATTPTFTVTSTKTIGAICGTTGAFPPGMTCGEWTVC